MSNRIIRRENEEPQSRGVSSSMASSSSRRASSAASSASARELERQLGQLGERNTWTAEQQQQQPLEQGQENVQVMVRCRPSRRGGANSRAAVQVDEAARCVEVLGGEQPAAGELQATSGAGQASDQARQASGKLNNRRFYFDRVFAPAASNEQVYMQSARRLVEHTFAGYNCTVFLYGQTGTGKTHTHAALAASSFEHLFDLIQSSDQRARFLIRASYYELYNEHIHDLLAPAARCSRSLELRESAARGVYVKDLSCYLVNKPSELLKLKQLGDKRRSTASTKMNEHSSRSHSIFSITIETTTFSDDTLETGGLPANGNRATSGNQLQMNESTKQALAQVRLGRLHLIDLAGSERQAKSGSTGARLKEASRINLSLTCLSLVIRALTETSKEPAHIPYRNSKLTRLLSSSLGGNSKSLLIACVAPELDNLDETLSTLRFASRTKLIKNVATINEDPKDALLRKYKRQVNELRRKLLEQKQAEGSPKSNDAAHQHNSLDDADSEQTKRQLELLKAKIMIGGENMLDKVELHERLLQASRAELEEKRRQEAKLREQLEAKRNTLEQVRQSKGSLESELHQIEARLEQATMLFKSIKNERRDSSSEQQLLKQNLLQAIKDTSKEIKYVDCIIQDFIPREYLDLINSFAKYDDDSDEWQIKYIAMSGNNVAQISRPIKSAL